MIPEQFFTVDSKTLNQNRGAFKSAWYAKFIATSIIYDLIFVRVGSLRMLLVKIIIHMAMLGAYIRDALPLEVDASFTHSQCPFHLHQLNHICEIKKISNLTTTATVYGLYQNYESDDLDMFRCKTRKQTDFNPIYSMHKITYYGDDFVRCFTRKVVYKTKAANKKRKIYTVRVPLEIIICGTSLFSSRLLTHLNNATIQDPTVGPSQWLQILRQNHKTQLIAELKEKNLQNTVHYTASELNQYINIFLPSMHLLRVLYYDLYINVWEKIEHALDLQIYRMGGNVIALDWTFKCLNKIWTTFDMHAYENEYFATEEKENDLSDSDLSNHEAPFKYDMRRNKRECKCATLVLQNQAHFSPIMKPTPKVSEKHCYLIPELAKMLTKMLQFSQTKIDKMIIKTDGLQNGINLPFKCISYMQRECGNVIKGAACDYVLSEFCRAVKAAVDGLHRASALMRKLNKFDAERMIIGQDRMDISTMADREPCYIDLDNNIDIMTYIKENAEIYENAESLQKLIDYTRATFLLRKTEEPILREEAEKLLKRDSDDYDFAKTEIRKALLYIAPEQLVYYTPILYGLISFDEHFESNLIIDKMHGIKNGSVIALTTPFLAAPVSTVKYLAMSVQLKHFSTFVLIRCGLHSFRHFEGILAGFYKLQPEQFFFYFFFHLLYD